MVFLTPFDTKQNAAATYQPKGDYATKQEVTDAIEAIPEVDLTPYETKANAAATYQPKGDYIDQETLTTTLVPYIQQAEAVGMFEKKTEAAATHQTINEQIQQLAVMFNNYLQKNSLKNTLFHSNTKGVSGMLRGRTCFIDAPDFDAYLTTINGTAINAALPGGRVEGPAVLEYIFSFSNSFNIAPGVTLAFSSTGEFGWSPPKKTIFSTGYAHSATFGILYSETVFLGSGPVFYEFSADGYRIYGDIVTSATREISSSQQLTLRVYAGERPAAALLKEEENV